MWEDQIDSTEHFTLYKVFFQLAIIFFRFVHTIQEWSVCSLSRVVLEHISLI